MKKITFEDRVPVEISDKMILRTIAHFIYSSYLRGETLEDVLDYCVDATINHSANTFFNLAEATSQFIWEFSK